MKKILIILLIFSFIFIFNSCKRSPQEILNLSNTIDCTKEESKNYVVDLANSAFSLLSSENMPIFSDYLQDELTQLNRESFFTIENGRTNYNTMYQNQCKDTIKSIQKSIENYNEKIKGGKLEDSEKDLGKDIKSAVTCEKIRKFIGKKDNFWIGLKIKSYNTPSMSSELIIDVECDFQIKISIYLAINSDYAGLTNVFFELVKAAKPKLDLLIGKIIYVNGFINKYNLIDVRNPAEIKDENGNPIIENILDSVKSSQQSENLSESSETENKLSGEAKITLDKVYIFNDPECKVYAGKNYYLLKGEKVKILSSNNKSIQFSFISPKNQTIEGYIPFNSVEILNSERNVNKNNSENFNGVNSRYADANDPNEYPSNEEKEVEQNDDNSDNINNSAALNLLQRMNIVTEQLNKIASATGFDQGAKEKLPALINETLTTMSSFAEEADDILAGMSNENEKQKFKNEFIRITEIHKNLIMVIKNK